MEIRPIEQTLARLATANDEYRQWLLTEPDTQAGWLLAAEVAETDAGHVDDLLARVKTRFPTNDAQAPAALWFGHYSYAAVSLALACYLSEQRVPDLNPAGLWARFDESGEVVGLALRNRAFTALADDPDAGHDDCTPVESREALRARLRAQIVAHLSPVVVAVRARSTFGKPGMWALAADYCASACAWLGKAAGDEAGALAEARLIAAEPSPLHRRRDFIKIDHCGQNFTMADRTSCCLYYKVDGGEFCTSCPHRPVPERIKLIKVWLERQAAGLEHEHA